MKGTEINKELTNEMKNSRP